ncbi:MAG: HAMP domain-containing protein [Deltaproteobacteria bacterium]|nr:HAMP domain-containing protein [Deltaproteobacteria bacterium]
MSNNELSATNISLGSFLYSIRAKFMAMILIFVAALMLMVIGLINKTVGETVLEQGIEKGLAVARGVATASDDPLLTNDDLTLFTVIKGITENKGVVYGLIVGNDKKIKAHSTVEESGKDYKEPADSLKFKDGKDYSIYYYNDPARGYIYDITVPITSVRLREGIGTVHIGLTRKVVDEAVDRVNRYIKYLTIFGLIIGGFGALLIATIIVKPVHALIRSAKEIGDGNFDYRMEVHRKDELGHLMASFNEMAAGLQQKQIIKESFGRYVAPEVLEMILHNRETWFKGKKTTVTVLFADIRGFTSYSERTDPETLINHLNEYFTLMTSIVQKNQGYIDKFIGDALMAVFGSPVHYEDHALCAARAACEMQEKLAGFNRGRPESDRIDIGIGINTGEVVAGNLGSNQKMEYAVIGDGVNTASRLCSAAKKGEIIISKSNYTAIKSNDFECPPLDKITVKGKAEPLEIFNLIPRRSPDRKDEDTQRGRRQAEITAS